MLRRREVARTGRTDVGDSARTERLGVPADPTRCQRSYHAGRSHLCALVICTIRCAIEVPMALAAGFRGETQHAGRWIELFPSFPWRQEATISPLPTAGWPAGPDGTILHHQIIDHKNVIAGSRRIPRRNVGAVRHHVGDVGLLTADDAV